MTSTREARSLRGKRRPLRAELGPYSIWNWMDRVTSILWIDCVPDVIDIWAIRDPNTTFLWHLAR